MKKMPVLVGAVLAALAVSACRKEVDELQNSRVGAADTVAEPAKSVLLGTGNWHQTGLEVSTLAAGASEAATASLFGHVKPSMLIQSASFGAGGSYGASYGAVPGAPTGPRQVHGTWQLSAAADTLVLTLPDYTQRFAVRELSATTLRLAYANPAENGSVATHTAVFEH